MSYKLGYTRHQLVKFTAEKIAILADQPTFSALYAQRALAWGTPGYPMAANAFDNFMSQFQEAALGIVIDAMKPANAGQKVEDAIFNQIVQNYADTAQGAPTAEQVPGTDEAELDFIEQDVVNKLIGMIELGDNEDEDES